MSFGQDSRKIVHELDNQTIRLHISDHQLYDKFINTYYKIFDIIPVPKIISASFDKGIIMENIGNMTLKKLFMQNPQEGIKYITKCLQFPKKLQSIESNNLELFSKNELLDDCATIFDYEFSKKLVDDVINGGLSVIHKDYQSTNIMISKNNDIKIIDFQDLCLGPKYYDFASIIFDANIYSGIKLYYPELNNENKELFLKTALIRIARSSKWRLYKYYHDADLNISPELNNILNMINDISTILNVKIKKFPIFLNTIILAAGKGKRMKSDLPKALTPFYNKPFLEYVINQARVINSDNIFVIIGYRADLIKQYIDNYHNDIHTVLQKELLGTGHAVMQMIDNMLHFHGNIIVLMADSPTIDGNIIKNLVDYHQNKNYAASLLTTESNDVKSTSARIIRNEEGCLVNIIEYADIVDQKIYNIKETSTGVGIFNCQLLIKYLPNIKNNNKQNEYYLTDIYLMMLKDGHKIGLYCDNNIPKIHGINTKDELEEACHQKKIEKYFIK